MGYYPKEIQESREDIELYSLVPKAENYRDLIPTVMVFDESLRGWDGIRLSGTGCVFYGPYINLQAGDYELYIQIKSAEISEGEIGTIEIVVDEEVIYSEDIRQSDTPVCIPFELTSEEGILQTRFIKTCEEDAECVVLRLCR